MAKRKLPDSFKANMEKMKAGKLNKGKKSSSKKRTTAKKGRKK